VPAAEALGDRARGNTRMRLISEPARFGFGRRGSGRLGRLLVLHGSARYRPAQGDGHDGKPIVRIDIGDCAQSRVIVGLGSGASASCETVGSIASFGSSGSAGAGRAAVTSSEGSDSNGASSVSAWAMGSEAAARISTWIATVCGAGSAGARRV
jgi:hypothetical protein